MRMTEEEYADILKKQGKTVAKDTPKTKANKYHAKKIWIDGIAFDSQLEGSYYSNLKLLQRAGVIKGFAMQCRFIVIEGNDETRGTEYVTDFIVFYTDGTYEIIDTKSDATTTDTFKVKFKAFKEKYPKLELKLIKEV